MTYFFVRPAGGAAVLTTLVAAIASAQTPLVPIPSATTQQSKEAYVDRVMDSSNLVDDGLVLKLDEYNSQGWPRSWRIDYSLLRQSSSGKSEASALGVTGFLDIPNYGSASLNAKLNQQRSFASANPITAADFNWRADLRAVPLDNGWRANYSLGNVNTTNTSLARSQSRIAVPNAQIYGVGGQWYRGDSVEINAAAGTTGLFTGPGSGAFENSGSTLQTVGARFKAPSPSSNSRGDAAVQLVQAHNISDGISTQNTRAVAISYAWEGTAPWSQLPKSQRLVTADRFGGLRVQANVLTSSSTNDGKATGVWADAAWRDVNWRNSAGAYRFEPNLRWGALALASNLQGVYWRGDRSSRNWQFAVSTEFSDSVTRGGTGRSAFVSTSGNYRLNQTNSIGAALNIKAISSRGASLSMNWTQIDDFGQSQWKGEFARTELSSTTRLGLDRSWNFVRDTLLSTSLAREKTVGGDGTGASWIWGVLGSWSPQDYSGWSLDAALRGATRNNGGESVNANIGLNWQSYSGWSLLMRYAESRGKEPLSPLLVSTLTSALQPAIVSTPANRSLQLILSYSGRAGSATAPIGGAPGSGGGSLSGVVFFDADNNGKREATEGGVAGVTVILDRSYVTRTDSQGRYEYSYVSAGDHLIEVSSDNVPLPWSPARRDPVKVVVLVRQANTLDFAVQRDR